MSLTHLGIIADGNRRWARQHGLPTLEGHKKGIEAISPLVDAAMEHGIQFITFYVFSTENWNRSKAEVSYLMRLAEDKILKFAEKLAKKNGRLRILGTKNNVPPKLASLIEKAERITENCGGITVGLCFNYGGEQEIADAAKIVVEEKEEVTPASIRKHLYCPDIPDLDMVVRTSGEERISGFMLWRASYAEFMFMEKYFPEMQADDIETIIKEYEKRDRRFGK